MTPTTLRDLRVLIGEDEQMLAIDLAQQLEMFGARVVGVATSVAQLEELALSDTSEADAAILDVRLLDGMVFGLVPRLEARGIGVVICSGYHKQDLPDGLAHIEWVAKPARAEDIASAIRRAVDSRRDDQID